MRSISLFALAAIVTLAIIPSPAAATHNPLFFKKDYAWTGVGYKVVDTFTVPATNSTWQYLCYHRSYFTPSVEASSVRITLKDAVNRTIVSDRGVTLSAYVVAIPLGAPGVVNQYTRGTFTLTFEGEGFNGHSRIRVYGVLVQSDCGKYHLPH